ncbi:MAG: WecB/TagA/CpsF family glycosyltransferase [candidate division KSB1 bacterium]|nr:WecB/TagA/CpsF family glycosyltransferase [candidate division KSB1 bacterium]MDZ7335957.1 WecB/TagA/CpsF family glycosyltransferase [candidate division KSB1 bacterium]MDZ7357923.1 WecB/TagA/CpsF family glycosyltransferase [candidate division KSB1 bacterium]MDZ7376267.1 WecB/TagA/CpsF family glycosyltransferase [candidate division KSB1 bacterium]MDZ7402178.1 WecB/TagA/CpsF family glycosyltransferase [candidate division KSB1 bacterium]
MNRKINVLGYPVDNLTSDEIIEQITEAINRRAKTHVLAINANKFYQSRTDPLLARIMREAEIVIPEYAFVWAAKKLNQPLAEHIGGIMLMRKLLEVAQRNDFSFFFLGAKPEVINQMVIKVKRQYGDQIVAGWHHGYFADDTEVIEQINRSGANILFVAMGVPRQEYFIHNNRSKIQVPVMLGVGGSFDVFAGIRKETPSYLRHGFEWIYRLIQDPKNLWKRYLTTNPYFVLQVLKHKFIGNGHRKILDLPVFEQKA